MKDHVESCHLTKFDDFRVNRDQVMDLETLYQTAIQICQVYMILRDAVSTLDTIVMVLETCFKVHNLISVYPKGIKLGRIK